MLTVCTECDSLDCSGVFVLDLVLLQVFCSFSVSLNFIFNSDCLIEVNLHFRVDSSTFALTLAYFLNKVLEHFQAGTSMTSGNKSVSLSKCALCGVNENIIA